MIRPRASHRAATHWSGETAYVGLLPAGPIVVLDGTGALLWALLTEGDGSPLTAQAARATGLDEETVGPGVDSFLAQARAVGIVTDD